MATDPALSIEEFATRLGPNARLLGLDLGTKTIGLALSDVRRGIATAMKTLKRVKFTKDAQELLAVCAEHDVGGLVIGLPLNMDGSEGPRVQATRAFVRNLSALTDLPIAYWDERLSTVAAERAMLAADISRAKRAEKIDATAAAFILQGALDRLSRLG
ncbi:MAG: Holliday junction resolvase RuvX [Hyphomicrobiales bacterium]|nr:MAG: Holliday junction resolvase RuvX [Hyphomicrobiales bacterium]